MSNAVSLYEYKDLKVQNAGNIELENLNLNQNDEVNFEVASSIYLRTILNNLRQFTASTKTRGEVSYSNKKPWKQKGTGNARCGDRKSPLWRHGGIIFGPRPGGRKLSVNRKISKMAWSNLFSKLFSANKVACLDLNEIEVNGSAKLLRSFVENVGKGNFSKIVLLLNSYDLNIIKTFRNFSNVNIEFYGREDFRSIATTDVLVFLKKDKELFESMVAKNDVV